MPKCQAYAFDFPSEDLEKTCKLDWKWPHLAIENYSRGNSARFINCENGRYDEDDETEVWKVSGQRTLWFLMSHILPQTTRLQEQYGMRIMACPSVVGDSVLENCKLILIRL